MKKVLICQVKDQADILPLFLGVHKRLFDRILLIDHRSAIDLRGLEIEGVDVVRVEARPHLQQVYPNLLIKELRLPQRFDWIFGLDVDEFLLISPTDFTALLKRHRRAAYLKLHWHNALFGDGAEPTPTTALRHKERSPIRKVAANARIIPDFTFIHGFHGLKYGWTAKLNPFAGKSRILPLPITHFPLGRGNHFGRKVTLSDFPHDKFWDKIVGNAPEHYRDACLKTVDGAASSEERMLVAAYYRAPYSDMPSEVRPEDIEQILLTDYLDMTTVAGAQAYLSATSAEDECPEGKGLSEAEQALLDLARRELNYFTPEMARALRFDREARVVTMAE